MKLILVFVLSFTSASWVFTNTADANCLDFFRGITKTYSFKKLESKAEEAFHPVTARFAQSKSAEELIESLMEVRRDYPVKGYNAQYTNPHFYVRWGALLLSVVRDERTISIQTRQDSAAYIVTPKIAADFITIRAQAFQKVNKILEGSKSYDVGTVNAQMLVPLLEDKNGNPIYIEDIEKISVK